MLEFDVWENQRLSVKEQVYRHDNRLNGDRPAWSTRDGKQGLHREAFLLPDLSWEWAGPWFIADLEGNPIKDAVMEKSSSILTSPLTTNTTTTNSNQTTINNFMKQDSSLAVSPTMNSPASSSASSGNSKGWLYAPSYLVSTKHCSSEANALSLVRRRRWVRKARKSIFGIALPHPNETILYGFSAYPEAVALCSQNPMAFPIPKGEPKSFAGKASAFFAKRNPFASSSNKTNSNNNNNNNNNNNSNSNSPAITSPQTGGSTVSSSSSSSPSVAQQHSAASNTPHFPGSSPNFSIANFDPKSLPTSAIGEITLLLKHQSTFDSMQSFMAQLFLQTKSADRLFSAAAESISPEIYQILRDSGIPQTLRAPIWLGFSGALHRKKVNRGKFKEYLERSRRKMENPNSSINLDVTRTCANHAYFSNGTGPGAKALRNVLFAYQEYAWEKIKKKKGNKTNNNNISFGTKNFKTRNDGDDDQDRQTQSQNQPLDLMAMMSKIENNKSNNNTDESQFQVDGKCVTASQNVPKNDNESSSIQQFRNNFLSDFSASPSEIKQQQTEQDQDHEDESLTPVVYHQPLSYICSVFVMTCADEEDAFWLLTVMVEECSLLQAALQDDDDDDDDHNDHESRQTNNNNSNLSMSSLNKMQLVVDKFCHDLKARAPPYLQELIGAVDFSIVSYSWFQALLCAHASAAVASRLFDIFLVNVRDSLVFVDFAVALVLKCLMEDNGAALEHFIAIENGGSRMLDTVSVSKFLNEQMRKVSCDLVL